MCWIYKKAIFMEKMFSLKCMNNENLSVSVYVATEEERTYFLYFPKKSCIF